MLTRLLLVLLAGWVVTVTTLTAADFSSHPPVRPLPVPSARALAPGPAKFVDAIRGNDAQDGSESRPFKTLAHAVSKLELGMTLYLRAGTYFEHVATTLVGTAQKPITIRAYPGELVTVDGGLPEFQLSPATAWESVPNGVAGEFRSTQTYPGIEDTGGQLRVSVMGRFCDSLLPLHGYWHHPDLQSDNPYWTLSGDDKVRPDAHVYCGPGLWYDTETDRIHVRLAHTKLPGLGNNNYRGETDPRKLPLVVATHRAGPVLTLTNSRYVRLQDLVLRGARTETLYCDSGANLEIDGCTLYGGAACLRSPGVHGLRVVNTACRGLAAPWTWRGGLKYRSIESRLIRTGGWEPSGNDGRDYEFAFCEFTDSVDGVFIGNINRVALHHSLIENISDDAIFVTSNTGFDGRTHGGGHVIAVNRFARNLTCFAFGVGHGRQKTIGGEDVSLAKVKKQLGAGLQIDRNVFDFRSPVMYRWPTGPDDVQEIDSLGRFAGDHGSPAWEPMEITHNTLLTGNPPRYDYGADGLAAAMKQGTRRRVFNNIICQKNGLPGAYFPPGDVDFAGDANLLWAAMDGPQTPALPKARYPRDQAPPPATWGQHDQYADPRFVKFAVDAQQPVDLRLTPASPAVNAGVKLTRAGLLRGLKLPPDDGAPDLGAIPLGSTPARIGCYGRFDLCGNAVDVTIPTDIEFLLSPVPESELPQRVAKPAAIVAGYPAFDEPLVSFALRARGVPVTLFERQWLDPREYSKFATVVIDGSFTRGRITPDRYSSTDLPIVRTFLEKGGTLWLMNDRQDIFAAPEGKRFLAELTGSAAQDRSVDYSIKQPQHEWLKGVPLTSTPDWLNKNVGRIAVSKGEVVIETKGGSGALCRIRVGQGQLIYCGLSPAGSMPNGRAKVTTEDERRFSEQMQILSNIVQSLYAAR